MKYLINFDFLTKTKLEYKYPLSFSRVSTFYDCLIKYYLHYMKNYPIESWYLSRGKFVHSIIEDYLKGQYFLDLNNQEIYLDTLFFIKKQNWIKSLKNLQIEKNFFLNRKLNSCKENDKNMIFRGFIDLYGFINDKEMVVVDWKTGRYKEKKWQDWKQLKFYSLYLFSKYPSIEKINALYYYINANKINKMVFKRIPDENDINFELLNWINLMIDNIDGNFYQYDFKPKFCNWCDFKEICYYPHKNCKKFF